jgi:hypothetical protein
MGMWFEIIPAFAIITGFLMVPTQANFAINKLVTGTVSTWF